MNFTSIDDLKEYVKTSVEEALVLEVAEKAKTIAAESAVQDVYSLFQPRIYERRGTMSNELFYETEQEGDLKVSIKPDAPFNEYMNTEGNSGNVAELIYYGQGGMGHYYGWGGKNYPIYSKPRKWMDTAREKLQDGEFKRLLKESLNARGIKTK